MGNLSVKNMTSSTPLSLVLKQQKYLEPVGSFKILDSFPEDTNNGLCFNGVYFPEEILMMILSYVEPKKLLQLSEVCKKWCNIIKSDALWASIYHRHYGKKSKKLLPWYVYYCALSTNYFDNNLLKNGNGQEGYKHWKVIMNYGDEFRIEDPPCGADPLPLDVPEFNGKTSCFATSFYECNKLQEISFENSRLMQFIMDHHKPHIYVSEWVAGRFDCGCVYTLWCKLFGKKGQYHKKNENGDVEEVPLYIKNQGYSVSQWEGSPWTKVELVVKDYPAGVRRIVFQHEGRDTQFWKGHYGSKMAGGMLKILFSSIEP